MANPASSFEQMILNNGPIQESIIRNLTRWDFRNLQLAGVQIPLSRGLQRRLQKPTRCDEKDPENANRRCANSTISVDDIRACAGRPVWIVDMGFHVEECLEAQRIRPCLQKKTLRAQDDSPDNEPNTGQYPIHSKVCGRCNEHYANKHLAQRLLTIDQFRIPLCKRHSLKHARKLPLNACRCIDYVNGNWRCRSCQRNAMLYLCTREGNFRRSISNVQIPWSHPFARVRNFWAAGAPVCPIDGCVQQPWWNEFRGERMQMCLGCNAIIASE